MTTTDNRYKYKKVIVDDIDISDFVLSFNCPKEFGKYIGTCTIGISIRIKKLYSYIFELCGKNITIQRGKVTATEEYVFRGEIINYSIAGGIISFTCYDKYYNAVKNSVNTSYDMNIDPEAGIGSEIFKNLIDENTDLSYSSTSIINTGTDIKIQKIKCHNSDVYEKLSKIAEIYYFQHYYNENDDLIHFEPIGYFDTGITLTVGQEILETPIWTPNKSSLCNSITIKGAEQLVEYTIYANGDNTEGQIVNLKYVPKSVKVYVGSGNYDPTGTGTKPSTNESNLKIGGKTSSVKDSYDYIYDDDKNIKKLYFYDSSIGTNPQYTPPVGTNNIEIQITYALPVEVNYYDEISINKYTLHHKPETLTNLKNYNDVYNYAVAKVENYKEPFISTTIKVSNANNILVGRKYKIIDPINNYTTYLIATKIEKKYPEGYDTVTFGNEIMPQLDFTLNTLDRLQRIEETIASADDLVIIASNFENIIKYENRYLDIKKKGYTEIDSLEHDTTQGTQNSLVMIDSTHFILAYAGTDNDGFIKTFSIDENYDNITEIDSLEHDFSTGSLNSLVMIDSTHFILAYTGTDNDGFIKTFSIDENCDNITEIDSLEHDTNYGLYNSLIKIDSTHFILAYDGIDDDGFIKTFSIDENCDNITEIDSLEHDTANGTYNSLIKIDSTHFILAYTGTESDGFIKTFSIDENCDNITEIDSIEHDTANGLFNSLVMIDSTHFILAYAGSGDDGFIKTFFYSYDFSYSSFLIQGNKIYKELFYDDDFYDNVNSDSEVSFNFFDKELTIPPNKTWYSKTIEKNTYRTNVIMNIEAITNDEEYTIKYEITGNGGITWTEFFPNILFYFSELTTDIRIRITNLGE
jgi:hypothetical protein